MTLVTTVLAQAADGGSTWLDTINSGGVVGYIIIGLSVFALALIIMHVVQIRRNALIPPAQLEQIDQTLAHGDVVAGLQFCLEPTNDSYLTRILAAGLTRFQKSAFGAFEIKNAIEEAGEDQTARLYRSTDALGVIGSIAPLLGLLGTVWGLNGAVDALQHGATPNHEELAGNISLALVTTLMGLILAIPCVALYRYFGNRIDAIASEAAVEIERLVLHLESTAVSQPGAPAPRSPTPARGQPVKAPSGAARPAPSSGPPSAPGTGGAT